jgi:hypothetical protein
MTECSHNGKCVICKEKNPKLFYAWVWGQFIMSVVVVIYGVLFVF